MSLAASPSKEALLQAYQGRSLHEIPVPGAVIDIAKVQDNCNAMLNAVKELGLSFRAHVKTHKTTEITRLQVGEECKDVRLIVSTVIEAERLVPLLQEYKSRKAKINVVYGVPFAPLTRPTTRRRSSSARRRIFYCND